MSSVIAIPCVSGTLGLSFVNGALRFHSSMMNDNDEWLSQLHSNNNSFHFLSLLWVGGWVFVSILVWGWVYVLWV